ncbi:MAG: matrixin family metalloprotease [Nanoarchaeota archaeon]|nr:matrixin family metalloprotease [Nanoarchaeota archaeon]
MKIIDFMFLIVLFCFLALGTYFLWLNLPNEQLEFETYKTDYSLEFPEQSIQFHKNMRFPESKIGYKLSDSCSQKKIKDFTEAAEFLSKETILSFYESDKPDIVISCSNIAPEPEEEGHFVAGEGGPAIIINSTQFAVIMLGKIALYRPETCDSPQIATHELLHALGFDHNSNKNSIMYPVTDCSQTLDPEIVEQIRKLYSIPSAGDLAIEKIEASKNGRYLNLDVVVANYGLKDSKDSTLHLYAKDTLVKSFELEELNIGSKKTLTITNVKIPRDTQKIKLVVETNEAEISRENNEAEISLIPSEDQ